MKKEMEGLFIYNASCGIDFLGSASYRGSADYMQKAVRQVLRLCCASERLPG